MLLIVPDGWMDGWIDGRMAGSCSCSGKSDDDGELPSVQLGLLARPFVSQSDKQLAPSLLEMEAFIVQRLQKGEGFLGRAVIHL